MTYVIAGSCIKDDSCIEVCPVDCIHPKPGDPDFETAEQLYIDPEVCIDCDACVEACPVDAIFGNVEVGTDVTHAELMEHYTAVIYATGAQTDKSLGIPGEDLPGSRPATEFVAWYNGHPDYRDLEFDLSGSTAVVIGNGNVAADVTRMLMLSPDELERTDVADHALEVLRGSRIREVVVLGRRGPAQAAFTSAELRELGRLDGVDVHVDA